MIENVDFDKLKGKFGQFLSHLSKDGKLSIQEINDAFVDNDFFDFLERNNASDFINRSFEDISKTIFGKDINFEYDGKELVMLFWAGMEYMNIAINENIPLRKVFLLLPLEEMLSLFSVYHEMNDFKMIEKWREIYKSRSILSILCKRKGITQKNLSIASGVDINSIKRYCKNNDNLSVASYLTIKSLLNVLGVSDVFIKKESDFIPYDDFLKDYAPFKTNFEKNIKDYVYSRGVNDVDPKLISFVYSDITTDEIKERLKCSKYVIVYRYTKVFSNEKDKVKENVLDQKIIDRIIKKSVAETINDSLNRGVLCF